jgi:hypothetical protein
MADSMHGIVRQLIVIIEFTIITPICFNQNSNVKGDPFAYFR